MSQNNVNLNLPLFNWEKDSDLFIEYLYGLGDEKYKSFSKKITPGDFEMAGVNIPVLKKISKEIFKGDYKSFLDTLHNDIFEVSMLKGLVISHIKDISLYKSYFELFLPLIDNWAICDTFINSSKIINRDREYFLHKCKFLLSTRDEFKNRVAFVILLNYFVCEEYFDVLISIVDGYRNDKYYANMALAWLLSVMCAKMPSKFKESINCLDLDKNVEKMTLRKICDSYRVSNEDKKFYKKLLK